MKKILSIPLILLILFSGISLNFSTHYCGGYVAATNVSLSGELAGCGMEVIADNNLSQLTFSTDCCDDVTSAYSISNNYLPSSFNLEDPVSQVSNLFFIPVDLQINQAAIINTSHLNVRPPGSIYLNSLEQPVLCIFRI